METHHSASLVECRKFPFWGAEQVSTKRSSLARRCGCSGLWEEAWKRTRGSLPWRVRSLAVLAGRCAGRRGENRDARDAQREHEQRTERSAVASRQKRRPPGGRTTGESGQCCGRSERRQRRVETWASRSSSALSLHPAKPHPRWSRSNKRAPLKYTTISESSASISPGWWASPVLRTSPPSPV